MHRRAQVTVEGLHLGKCESIAIWRKPRIGKLLANEGEDCRCFGKNTSIRHKGGDAALRIDRQELRLLLIVSFEIHPHLLIVGPGFLQGNERGKRAGAWCMAFARYANS